MILQCAMHTKNNKFHFYDEERRNFHGENVDEGASVEENGKNAFFIHSSDDGGMAEK